MISDACPNCGQNLTASERAGRFCPKCGKELSPQAAPSASAAPPPISPQPAGANKATFVLDYGKRVTLTWWEQAHKAFAKVSGDIHISTAEQDQLAARGILGPAVQLHFVWRRSLLWFIVLPTIFAAVLGTIDTFREDLSSLSVFGILMSLLYAASLWAIPACVVLAARIWDQPQKSRRILMIGFLASFSVIVLMGIMPFKFWIKYDTEDPMARQFAEQTLGVVGGLYMMFLMLPAILSLLPGAIRACVRIKVLFPQSIVSGWLLITVTPLYALFLLSIFVLVNQVAGNFLLIMGMAALVGAPVVYLVNTPLFIRPLWSDEDRKRIARAQWIYFWFLIGSVVLLLIYAFSATFFNKPLVGLPSNNPVISIGSFIWHAFKFLIDYIGRSLFITSIALDFFLLINVSVWENMRKFEQTEQAGEYEKTIEELGKVLN